MLIYILNKMCLLLHLLNGNQMPYLIDHSFNLGCSGNFHRVVNAFQTQCIECPFLPCGPVYPTSDLGDLICFHHSLFIQLTPRCLGSLAVKNLVQTYTALLCNRKRVAQSDQCIDGGLYYAVRIGRSL